MLELPNFLEQGTEVEMLDAVSPKMKTDSKSAKQTVIDPCAFLLFVNCIFYFLPTVCGVHLVIVCSHKHLLLNKVKLHPRLCLLATCRTMLSEQMCMYILLVIWLIVWMLFWLRCLCRENFFKDAGEVADVRFASDPDGRFKGFGHVEFATAEAAQKVSFVLSRCYCLINVRLVKGLPDASNDWNCNTENSLIPVKFAKGLPKAWNSLSEWWNCNADISLITATCFLPLCNLSLSFVVLPVTRYLLLHYMVPSFSGAHWLVNQLFQIVLLYLFCRFLFVGYIFSCCLLGYL